ncbi:MAG: hemolysin family protein [Polyangiales bacterium]|nr:HlyC/CorC family transporter [Sandaracinaceae bacterium]
MTTLLMVIAVSLAISSLCSVLEAVLLSVTHGYVALLEKDGDPSGPILAKLRRNLDEPIAAILTLNTIAHTIGAAVSGAMALEVLGSEWMAAFSAALTLAILVLSEIIPKTLGARHWQALAPATARILQVMIKVMWLVLAPLSLLNKLIGAKGHGGSTISRAELAILAEMGRREGQIEETEWRVVSNVMSLRGTHVSEVMTPRTAMVSIPVTASLADAQQRMLDTGFLRMPVYGEGIDNIVGVLLARDLWRATRSGGSDLSAIMRDPLFVPETTPVDDLISEMRKRRIKMAFVLDEYGGTSGLVTLEDLVEEIVGEIHDEHEVDPVPFERVGPNEVLVAGSAALSDVAQRFDVELPVDLYDTLGGYVFGELKRLPGIGDEVPFPGGTVRVLAMDKRRVTRVSVTSSAVVEPDEEDELAAEAASARSKSEHPKSDPPAH